MSELRQFVADAARAAFGDVRDANPGEAFYGFALEVADGTPTVGASANTERGLLEVARRYAADGYGQVEALASDGPGSLRWRTVDWVHRPIGDEHFAEANAFITQAIGGEGPDQVVRALVGACRDLNREDFFGWGPERDAVVVLITTSDPADLLELARDVNPATPFARLQLALG